MHSHLQSYIEQLLNPLLLRITSLQSSNEELKAHLRRLQQFLNCQHSYQRPTLSATQHMRESRLSSKDSQLKRPTWNINTKLESPTKTTNEVSHQKIKTKPPVPKIVKSPAKQQHQLNGRSRSTKRTKGGINFQSNNIQHEQRIQNSKQSFQSHQDGRQGMKVQNGIHESSDQTANIQFSNNKFQRLLKQNTQLVQQMKKEAEKTKQQGLNYVRKTATPNSYHNHSKTTSPNSRSLVSQNECHKRDGGQSDYGVRIVQN